MNQKQRNLCGYWLLGLFNNFSYVIMLSAAHDLLHSNNNTTTVINSNNNTTTVINNSNNTRDCNQLSTGVILLADVLPAIIVKLIAPFVVLSMNIKVIIVVIMSSLSFIIVSVSTSHMVTIIGVVCASISSGLGEASFLSFTHYFSECVIGAWSSGGCYNFNHIN